MSDMAGNPAMHVWPRNMCPECVRYFVVLSKPLRIAYFFERLWYAQSEDVSISTPKTTVNSSPRTCRLESDNAGLHRVGPTLDQA